jgi:hypothetical protein
MKNYREPRILKRIFFIVALPILLLISNMIFAQDDKPLRIYLDIMCYQKDTGKDLRATVRARIGENRKIMPVAEIPINFYNITDSSEVLLGTASSDEEGVAIFTITRDRDLFWNKESGYSFSTSFDGNEKFRKASKNISIKEAKIEITFSEIDSTRIISAKAYEIDPSDSKRMPLNGIDLSFYVPGTFSLYKIGEGELNDGVCNVDFPVTLPGDSEGNLTVIARIEESDDYGFVEGSSTKDWGMVRENFVLEEKRGLGDTDAPLWMVYTLIVLLSAVWIHYIYVFVVIYLIKKEGKVGH